LRSAQKITLWYQELNGKFTSILHHGPECAFESAGKLRTGRNAVLGLFFRPQLPQMTRLRHHLPEVLMYAATSRPKPVLPLGIKNKVKTELPALVALSAIGEPWFSPQHQSDLLAVALVVHEMAPEGTLPAQSAVTLRKLCAQEITAEHKVDIALNLAECLPWLQVQPNSRIDRAVKAVARKHRALAA
jgi:hypothetical protein